MLLHQLVTVSEAVSATRKRLEKRRVLAALLREAGREQIALVVSYLIGRLPQGRIGFGPALLRDIGPGQAERASLTLVDLDAWVDEFAAVSGKGAKATRRKKLEQLWVRATENEGRFLYALLLGELRQGALEGLLIDAIAEATDVAAAQVRRATMLAGTPVPVAVAASCEGAAAVAAFRLRLMQGVQPMLAQPGELESCFSGDGEYMLEYKLDGARVQVHRRNEEVKIFSRQLHDVTRSLPELVEMAQALPANEFILDGEAIALREGGSPYPFQTTMRRFGRRSNVDEMRAQLPLSMFIFDCLHLDGEDLLDLPLFKRLEYLDDLAPALRPPRRQASSSDDALAFLDAAFDAGHEGLMVKDLRSLYQAGSRGADWRKIKQVHTLDLVVLAAEWGSGRRQGWLSNLHLGARDADDSFVMLGKTFKGLTDAMLSWQTEQLLARETARDGHVVYVRPELMVEIAVNEIQRSPHYPAGLALRFARVKAFREDKTAEEADTITAVQELFAKQGAVREPD
ncbi:MAG: ATP-dependent DNA ligase [Pseudomonadota bacterium]